MILGWLPQEDSSTNWLWQDWPTQWTSGLGLSDNVLLNFAPSDKNIKVISFSVFQIFHETSMFLDHSKTNAKSQRISNSQA